MPPMITNAVAMAMMPCLRVQVWHAAHTET
jgi:hypothetical protein